MRNEKKNVTIRINEGVLEKAKKLGLNLSATVESMLGATTLAAEKEIIKTSELRDAYRQVFIDIIDLLKEWGVNSNLRIGGYISVEDFYDAKRKASPMEVAHEYYLSQEGKIEHYLPDFEQVQEVWRLNEEWPIQNIYKSEKIISILVDTLYENAEENKEKLEDVEVLKNILRKLKESERKSEKDGI